LSEDDVCVFRVKKIVAKVVLPFVLTVIPLCGCCVPVVSPENGQNQEIAGNAHLAFCYYRNKTLHPLHGFLVFEAKKGHAHPGFCYSSNKILHSFLGFLSFKVKKGLMQKQNFVLTRSSRVITRSSRCSDSNPPGYYKKLPAYSQKLAGYYTKLAGYSQKLHGFLQ
jgi:hypothetical protein